MRSDAAIRPQSPWGKFDGQGSHHLAHHCADVAACFEAMVALPVIRARLEAAAGTALSPSQIARLAVLVFLHDIGKLHPGFQTKGWPEAAWQGRKHGHLQEGLAIFNGGAPTRIRDALGLLALADWRGLDLDLVLAALAHHGRPFAPHPDAGRRWDTVPGQGYDPAAAARDIALLLRSWFSEAFAPSVDALPTVPAFQHVFCGLVSLADWVGSDARIFRFVADLDPDYMATARTRAREAVVAIGLDARTWQQALTGRTDFLSLTGFDAPRPQQALVDAVPLTDRLVILEAETGSGKTEAALWRFAKLFEAGLVDSLYFALPTRAAAMQLHDRVERTLRRLFGDRGPQAVLAVPGYLRVGETQGQALPDWQVRWDDDSGANEAALLARWAAENAKRYLAATVAVGTVDQAMLAGLQVKHAHLRAGALARSLLVIDEVHASDPYMTAVQIRLLRQHLARGGHALLMSATLGATARCAWLDQPLPPFAEAAAIPYPAVWGQSRAPPRHAPPEGAGKSVAMRSQETARPEETAQRAIAAAEAGGRVLVVRNTVTDTIATWQAVRNAGAERLLLHVAGGPALHHGRFAPEDRQTLDIAVESALSPRRREPGGVIVIGTQTLEQSLDIDADVLLTDLCPADVLLQRIGRLHRHRLPRPPGFEAPACTVAMPEEGLAPLLKPAFAHGLGGWMKGKVLQGIYYDLAGLELTRRLIADHPIWTLPAMNRFLVEAATHPDRVAQLTEELGDDWAKYDQMVRGRDAADAVAGMFVALPVDQPFSDTLFPSDEETIRTRLGAEGARLRFTAPVDGPFGTPITGLTLPDHYSRGLDPTEPVTPVPDGDGLRIAVGDRAFRYDRRGITKETS